MVPYVDILIPTKDRAMQLHLLLESMGRHLKNMGRITITWQGSNGEFVKGYELLKQRVNEDSAFALLRKNSKEIMFRQRTSLAEVYEAAMDSGDSNYIMPLVDDDVFIGEYDLVNHPASCYFFENKDVFSCSLRLGDNLSEQLSSTTGDGVVSRTPAGHATSLLSTGKPRFVIPEYNHLLSSGNDRSKFDFLVWAWPENLNVPHWSCVLSTTGHIYRKKMYNDMYCKFGKNNFLNIEGEGLNYLIKMFLSISSIALGLIWIADKISMRIQKTNGMYEQEVFLILLLKYLYRKRLHRHREISIPYLMVCPLHSAVCNLDIKASHNRKNVPNNYLIESYNCSYLEGYIIAYEMIPTYKIVFPYHIFNGFEMRKY